MTRPSTPGSAGLTAEKVKSLRKLIYSYYRKHGRGLPWRLTRNPYHVLVSEIMLQQTSVGRVAEKYEKFLAAFPDLSSLTKAPLQEVLKVWQGLGYNRRALALKQIAELVVTRFNGVLPSSPETLASFPGVGPYTASAVCAFVYSQPTVFIETNIRTVFIHFFFKDRRPVSDREILSLVEKTLDRSNPREWYYALMDYGAMLKKRVGNLSQRSSYYRKQPPFQGSDRQIRGIVLKTLTAGNAMSEREIARRLQTDPGRVRKVLLQLEREGFVKRQAGRFTIA